MNAAKAYDLIAKDYGSLFTQKFHAAEDAVAHRPLRKALTSQSCVLDIGCGDGTLLRHAGLDPRRYLGIDVSEQMVEGARARWPQFEFRCVAAERIQKTVAHSAFDAVVSLYGAFNYVHPFDLGETLGGIHATLRCGGVLVASTYAPALENAEERICVSHYGTVRWWAYSSKYLRIKLKRAGFRNIDIRGYSYYVERLPKCLPQWMFNTFAAVESGLLSLFVPDRAYYLLVTAEKR